LLWSIDADEDGTENAAIRSKEAIPKEKAQMSRKHRHFPATDNDKTLWERIGPRPTSAIAGAVAGGFGGLWVGNDLIARAGVWLVVGLAAVLAALWFIFSFTEPPKVRLVRALLAGLGGLVMGALSWGLRVAFIDSGLDTPDGWLTAVVEGVFLGFVVGATVRPPATTKLPRTKG
jgi:hypothetical protein